MRSLPEWQFFMDYIKKYLSTILIVILFVASIIGIIICLIYITTSSLSSKENLLLSILLTICSALISWIITVMYAKNENSVKIEEIKSSYKKDLRIYALKAAEKVDNLSNELNKLAVFLKDELDEENENIKNDLYAKKERIKSSIHIIGTLKSINDKSLSDWNGVIPTELEERDEEERETTEKIIEAKTKLNKISELPKSSEDKYSEIISELQREIDHLIFSKTGNYTYSKNAKAYKTKVISNCPNCGHILIYKQRPQSNSIKSVRCTSCDKVSLSKWSESRSFYLELDEGSNVLRKKPKKLKFDEELIQAVSNKLPKQPWPKGVHKKIKDELGISNYKLKGIINILIDRGVFLKQVNGKLFSKESKT
jgi:hypothetical protein